MTPAGRGIHEIQSDQDRTLQRGSFNINGCASKQEDLPQTCYSIIVISIY